MIRKNALLLASALTAFVLVAVGGVAGRVSAQTDDDAQEVQTPSEAVDPQALAAVLQEREAAYRGLIEQANARLSAQALATPTPSTPVYPISPDTAVAIVLTTVRGASLQSPPELVDFMGAAAYEVVLDRGPVYVDANTGKILANGAVPQVVVVQDDSNGGGGGGERDDDDHDEEDEHDEQEDD